MQGDRRLDHRQRERERERERLDRADNRAATIALNAHWCTHRKAHQTCALSSRLAVPDEVRPSLPDLAVERVLAGDPLAGDLLSGGHWKHLHLFRLTKGSLSLSLKALQNQHMQRRTRKCSNTYNAQLSQTDVFARRGGGKEKKRE